MNSLFKHGKYDFAPKGAKISVRLDPIYVVDKITRRTQSSVPENGTFDGAWEYGSPGAMEYCNLSNSYMWALDHELTHQLGIIDDYQLDLGPGGNEINGKGFGQPDGGMMGGGHVGKNAQPSYSDIDIAGMNATYSKRRGFFGEYLYNVPTKNTLVLTIDGKPAANADVQVYQKTNGKMAGDPVFRGKTDAEGRFALANRPPKKEFTTATGCTLKPNPFGHIDVVGGNGLFLVRANAGGKWYYQFIDIGHFVCEYARGHKKSASYPLELTAE
jgi:hypothetical protein